MTDFRRTETVVKHSEKVKDMFVIQSAQGEGLRRNGKRESHGHEMLKMCVKGSLYDITSAANNYLLCECSGVIHPEQRVK